MATSLQSRAVHGARLARIAQIMAVYLIPIWGVVVVAAPLVRGDGSFDAGVALFGLFVTVFSTLGAYVLLLLAEVGLTAYGRSSL